MIKRPVPLDERFLREVKRVHREGRGGCEVVGVDNQPQEKGRVSRLAALPFRMETTYCG